MADGGRREDKGKEEEEEHENNSNLNFPVLGSLTYPNLNPYPYAYPNSPNPTQWLQTTLQGSEAPHSSERRCTAAEEQLARMA